MTSAKIVTYRHSVQRFCKLDFATGDIVIVIGTTILVCCCCVQPNSLLLCTQCHYLIIAVHTDCMGLLFKDGIILLPCCYCVWIKMDVPSGLVQNSDELIILLPKLKEYYQTTSDLQIF